jgi:hypothetical protein
MTTDESTVVIITIFVVVVVVVVETGLLVYFICINAVRYSEISFIKIREIFVAYSFISEVVPANIQYKNVKE